MKIYIGADHRGFKLKERIIKSLKRQHYPVVDCGSHNSEESVDYPHISYKVARAVAKSKTARGILICMTGIGPSMAANKVRGVFAALCYNRKAAKLSREHNNANVLVLGSKFVSASEISLIIKVWLNTKFEGGRHQRRVNQIKGIERKVKKHK